MSEETFRLLTSSDATTGYLVGLVALVVVGVVSFLGRRPVPIAGLAIAAAGLIALELVHDVRLSLLAGLLLLAAAGLIPAQNTASAMAAALPGAVMLGYSFVDEPDRATVVFVVAGVVLLAPMVVAYDGSSSVGATLLAISYVGALLVVPDTDVIIVVVAAVVPLTVVGFPLRFARLGRSGAMAAAGLAIWSVAAGAAGRVAALVAGASMFGLLAAVPIAAAVGGGSTKRDADLCDTAIHGFVCLAVVLVISLSDQPVLVGVAGAALWVGAVRLRSIWRPV